MIASTGPVIDARDSDAFVDALLARRAGFVDEWQPGDSGADIALAQVLGHFFAAIVMRLDQAPDKHQLAMLDQLGVDLIPAQASRAPVVFALADNANDAHVPAGTRLAAKAPDPPPVSASGTSATGATGGTPTPPGPVLFETERATGLASAKLVELRSVWPGRDQSIDHMPAHAEGQPFQPWLLADLDDMPHHIYVAHSRLLALSGSAHVAIDFELTQGASEPLDSVWEYWDGKVWRPFQNTIAACDHAAAAQEDSTARFRQTGTVHLRTDCAETKATTVDGIEDFWVRGRLTEPLLPDPSQLLPEVEQVKVSTVVTRPVAIAGTSDEPVVSGGFLPDQAIVDDAPADLSKPFYPFGMQPQPGSVFYFSAADAFAKPNANLTVAFLRTRTPQDELQITDGGTTVVTTPIDHTVVWEYWNGREWATALASQTTGDATLDPELDAGTTTTAGTVSVTVPSDMETTTVANVEARWMRVRLVSGGFGFRQQVSWYDSDAEQTNALTYVVSRPPALAVFKLGYSWTYGPFPPEHVLTYNDFQYQDRTDAAVWPGQVFRPFTPPADVTPGLYLGFDRALPVDELGIFFDIVEDRRDTLGPALVWEYWDGGAWRVLRVDDETRRLRMPGLVGLIGPEDSEPLARFGTSRWWLRARLQEDGPPGAPTVRGLFPNATWAVQHQTVVDDPIGASTGLPDQALRFRQAPVLAGEQIDVRELAGARANVEWRIVVRELYGALPHAISEIEARLGREGADPTVEYGRLRLQRDRNKQVTEVWVRWERRDTFARSRPNDRHYVLERTRGGLRFGDGTEGKVPPAGAAIVARRYQTGGGSVGNVPVGAIAQLQAAVGGVKSVTNPVAAEGGADAETLDALRARGPYTLRHRGRAIAAVDLATIAREASPAVAVATALPTRTADGHHRPGAATIVIVPATADARPWPSFGLREQVREYVEARACAGPAGLHTIEVTGPSYLAVDVDATIVPRTSADAGAVQTSARDALARLLHPLYGGPDNKGWPPGRDVYLSDVAAVLEHVDGVDYVSALAISVDGRIGGEVVAVAPDRTVVAGALRLKVVQG